MCPTLKIESVDELKKICLKYKYDEVHKQTWASRHLKRPVSIRITRLALILGLSANQATVISLLFGIGSGICFIWPKPQIWLLGLLFIYLAQVFDCVDGEIARYRKQASSEGRYLDVMVTYFMYPFLIACMSFGLYRILQSLLVFIVGFMAIIWINLVFVHTPLVHSIRYEQKLPYVAPKTESGKGYAFVQRAYKIAKAILLTPSLQFIPQFLLATVIDMVVETFMLAGLTVNARLIYLAILAIGLLASAITRYFAVRRYGVTVSVGAA
jgi:phosphatidylglycerophosphate synthase